MELLEEYQRSLEKIKSLEEQIKDIKESIKVVSKGIKTVCNELQEGADIFDDASSAAEVKFREEMFVNNKKMLEQMITVLNMPFMDEDERKDAEVEVVQSSFEVLQSKMKNFLAGKGK